MNLRIAALLAATLAVSMQPARGATSSTSITEGDHANGPGQGHHQSEHPMEHVIVSMPAHRQDARTAMPVTVLSNEALRRQAALSLGETLSQMPGLASASFGPAVGQPVIRGQHGPRVMVLENGLPSLDVSSNSADHAISAEPLLADSIEVLRGSSSLLYGGGAIGGVVNVIDGRIPSRPQNGLSGAAEIRHSSVDNGRNGVFRVDAGDGQWAWHVDGLYRDWDAPDIPGLAINPANVDDIEDNSDGVLSNADGRGRRLSLGGARHYDSGYWGVSYTHLDNRYGIPAGVHHHDDHSHDDLLEDGHHDEHDEAADDGHGDEGGINLQVKQRRWDLAGDQHFAEAALGPWELLRWRLTYSEYEHREVEADGEVGTLFQRDAAAARLELVHQPIGDLHGVVGLQALSSTFSAEGEEAFVPETEQRNLGLFWLEDLHGDGWQVELGLRGEFDQLQTAAFADRDTHSVSGSVGGTVDLSDQLQVGLSLAQSRRAPSAEERYANGMNSVGSYVVHGATGLIELGDADLGRETANSGDLLFKADFDELTAEVSLFYADFNDYIYLANSGTEQLGSAVYQYRQQDARFSGLEYRLDYLLWQGLGEFSVGLFGDRIRAQLDQGGDIPRLPPRRDGLRMGWTLSQLSAELSWVRAAAQTRPGQGESPTAGYHRLDASVSWAFDAPGGRYTLSVRCKNLGDEMIRSSSSFIRDYAPEPGRSLELALRLDLGD